MYDIIVVGAGTAGLTASIYARRAEKSVLIIESGAYGGQIISTPDIENYPAEAHIAGYEFAEKLYRQAKDLGAVFVSDRATGLEKNENETFFVKSLKSGYAGNAVILATGSKSRRLGLDGEDALIGRGISYCATCDGNFFRGKTVAVVGGGNTAAGDALYLSDIASKVYLIHRRESFRADGAAVDRLKKRENISFILGARVTKLIADRRLEAIEMTLSDGRTSTIGVSGLFVAIGRIPENGPFADWLELDAAGYAVSNENCRTKTPGLFVAGDCRAKEVRQLVTAAADGAVAATGAVNFISSLKG